MKQAISDSRMAPTALEVVYIAWAAVYLAQGGGSCVAAFDHRQARRHALMDGPYTTMPNDSMWMMCHRRYASLLLIKQRGWCERRVGAGLPAPGRLPPGPAPPHGSGPAWPMLTRQVLLWHIVHPYKQVCGPRTAGHPATKLTLSVRLVRFTLVSPSRGSYQAPASSLFLCSQHTASTSTSSSSNSRHTNRNNKCSSPAIPPRLRPTRLPPVPRARRLPSWSPSPGPARRTPCSPPSPQPHSPATALAIRSTIRSKSRRLRRRHPRLSHNSRPCPCSRNVNTQARGRPSRPREAHTEQSQRPR